MSVTIDQAAELLHRSRRTIYNRIREGHLDTIRIGNSQRVTAESLMRQPELRPRLNVIPLGIASIPHPRRIA